MVQYLNFPYLIAGEVVIYHSELIVLDVLLYFIVWFFI